MFSGCLSVRACLRARPGGGIFRPACRRLLVCLISGVGTMRNYVPPSSGLVPPVPPSQRCGLCQNFKQTTLTTRLYKVRTNLYPPLTKTFRRACVREHISGTTQPILTKMCMTYIRGSVLLWWRCDRLCTSGLWMTSYLYIMGHMQGCRCNTGTASQSAWWCSQAARPWAVAETASRRPVSAWFGSSVATWLFEFSPDFVSKKPRKTQVLKTTFRAPKLRASSLQPLHVALITNILRPTYWYNATLQLI